jgi:DNA-binding CsgD family transcriptional regulator
MDDARAVLGTAEQLYAAAAAPELWPDALDAVVELMRGRHGFLHVQSTGGAFAAHAGVDERDAAHLYSPEAMCLSGPLLRLLPLGVAQRNELISDRDFARSQCYNELFRPLHGFHSVHLRRADPAHVFILTVCRARHAETFAAGDTALLRTIEPHLSTALALCHRLGVAEHWTHGLARTLDRLDTGVILADTAARPVFANARARRILAERDGLTHEGEMLTAATVAATQMLRRAMLLASGFGNGTHIDPRCECEEQLRLDRPSGRAPLLLAILPIWRLDVAIAGLPSPRVAVFVTEPDAPCAIDRSAVADTFRLTRREADVALLLAAGCDLPDIAARLGLGLSTVRSHLKRVFYKTDVHSQGALAALVRGFVAPFD